MDNQIFFLIYFDLTNSTHDSNVRRELVLESILYVKRYRRDIIYIYSVPDIDS